MIEQKFDALLGFPQIGKQSGYLKKIKEKVLTASDWELFRINPFRFADSVGVEVNFAIEFFIHASKIGLFDFQWNIICAGCSGIEYSHATIGQISSRSYHCMICNVDIPTFLDDQVEVAFTINPSVRRIAVNPFESFETYRRFFFSENYRRSAELAAYSQKHFRGFGLISPDQRHIFQANVMPGETYRLLNMVSHTMAEIIADPTGNASEQILDIELAARGFLNTELRVRPGPVQVAVWNRSKDVNAATMLRTDYDLLKTIMVEHPNEKLPFFTAKMLINLQSFRDLFRVQDLPDDFNLNVRSVALLFTDLKGSTSLYEKSGDLRAFNIVQKHFKILTESVRAHSGAIVKTMGDALMASFSVPSDAVEAALSMLAATDGFWEKHGVPDMGLKIGIHEGPALAVNADNRLDYFGQTVNTAARLQDLAQVSEIVLSKQVGEFAEIEALLQRRARGVKSETAKLRGIDDPQPIYRILV